MPMKIASRKNEKPSIANPSPKTAPKVPVKFGHKRPISKLRIVPVTTPTGNRATITRLSAWRVCGRGRHPCADRATRRTAHRREGDSEADQRDVHHEGQ